MEGLLISLQRYLRLSHQKDFALLRTQGKAIRHHFFVMSYHHNDLPHHRYGIIVTKRLGKAVERNKVRRRLREVIRHYHPQISGINGVDIVVVARFPIMKAPFHEIVEALGDSLKRAGLLTA